MNSPSAPSSPWGEYGHSLSPSLSSSVETGGCSHPDPVVVVVVVEGIIDSSSGRVLVRRPPGQKWYRGSERDVDF